MSRPIEIGSPIAWGKDGWGVVRAFDGNGDYIVEVPGNPRYRVDRREARPAPERLPGPLAAWRDSLEKKA